MCEVVKGGYDSLGYCESKRGGIEIIQNEHVVRKVMVGIDQTFSSWREV